MSTWICWVASAKPAPARGNPADSWSCAGLVSPDWEAFALDPNEDENGQPVMRVLASSAAGDFLRSFRLFAWTPWGWLSAPTARCSS